MPFPKDPIKAEEARRKMSEAAKRRMADPEIRKKIREANIGKTQSPETITKRVEKLKGKKHPPRSEASRSKYSEAVKKLWEDPDYHRRMSELHTGKKQSPETIEKRISKIKPRASRTKKTCTFCGKDLILVEWESDRKFCSMECKGKWQAENAVGENSSHWQGGDVTKKCEICGKEFSVEKNRMETAKVCSRECAALVLLSAERHDEYCDFFDSVKPRSRAFYKDFYGDICPLCQEFFVSSNGSVHHVYWERKSCCQVIEEKNYTNLNLKNHPRTFEIMGTPDKFIVLCKKCHTNVWPKNFDKRAEWARHIEKLINEVQGGKSFYTMEEFYGDRADEEREKINRRILARQKKKQTSAN
jgi:endogenous inhibitor of DNA gyrase (YacG/DUF329 family)